MLTYTADTLRALRHDRPPNRHVRKELFSARLWRPRAARQSADHPYVNKQSADRDRYLRVGWLNVRSLANKSVAVHETISAQNLDVLALTETWHHDSSNVCLRQAAPSDFAVVDAVRSHQPGYGGIAVLYAGQLRCRKVDLPPTKSFEALCVRFTVSNSTWLLLTIGRDRVNPLLRSSTNYLQYWRRSSLMAVLSSLAAISTCTSSTRPTPMHRT